MLKNLLEVYKWIKKFVDQGNVQVYYNFGFMYRNGDGVEKDFNKVKFYFIVVVKGGVKFELVVLKELMF